MEPAEALGKLSDAWLDPAFPFRQEALAALPVSTGLSPRLIEDALDAAFGELLPSHLKAYAENEIDPSVSAPKTVLVMIAGNVFTAWLPAAYTALLLRSHVRLKPSTQEPVFAPLWKRSLDGTPFGEAVEIVAWKDGLLTEADAVVAYGSDETLKTLREQMPAGKTLVGYGHKASVAVVFREALRDMADITDMLKRDVEPFQLEGCLSPRIVYVEGDAATLRKALGIVQPAPAFRAFQDFAQVLSEWETARPPFSALGFSGDWARFNPFRDRLSRLGFTRICPLGQMQRPPLAWHNGGFSLVQKLQKAPI